MSTWFEYGAIDPRRLLRPLRAGELSPPSQAEGDEAWALNSYAGCELAGVYAPPPRREPRQVLAKRGAPALLAEELRRAASEGHLARTIVLGSAVDPWQPLEARERVTRGLLQVLLEVAERTGSTGRGRSEAPRLVVLTRSPLIVRDLELLRALDRALPLRVAVALPTLDPQLSRRLEPGAPDPARRLEALQTLARAGLVAGALCEPVLPELTESPRDLRRIVCAARMAGARFMGARLLSLRGPARGAFFGWLRRERPDLLRSYAQLYRGAQVDESVRERVQRLLTALRGQYDLPAWVDLPAPPVTQRALFASPAPPAARRVEPAA